MSRESDLEKGGDGDSATETKKLRRRDSGERVGLGDMHPPERQKRCWKSACSLLGGGM